MVEQELQESRRQSIRDGSYYPFEDGAEGEFSHFSGRQPRPTGGSKIKVI
jgi:hypothetical protein